MALLRVIDVKTGQPGCSVTGMGYFVGYERHDVSFPWVHAHLLSCRKDLVHQTGFRRFSIQFVLLNRDGVSEPNRRKS
jgi:hypothetical protein